MTAGAEGSTDPARKAFQEWLSNPLIDLVIQMLHDEDLEGDKIRQAIEGLAKSAFDAGMELARRDVRVTTGP